MSGDDTQQGIKQSATRAYTLLMMQIGGYGSEEILSSNKKKWNNDIKTWKGNHPNDW